MDQTLPPITSVGFRQLTPAFVGSPPCQRRHSAFLGSRRGVPAFRADELVKGSRFPCRPGPGGGRQRKRPPPSPMLNFDRPLFHAQSAAVPRVGVAENAAAP